MYADAVLMPALAARGLTVVDLRRRLPHNTTYPRARAWDRRPLEAISVVAVHYDAIPLRPIGRYDAVARYVAEARDHIAKDWGNGWHAPTIAYLLKIDGQPDDDLATVYVLNDVEDVTWNANDANGIDVAVCVDLGQGQEPFRSQLATLQRVLDVFDQDTPELPCSHSETYGHGELTDFGNATSCPGALLPYVQRYRETGALFDGATDYQGDEDMAKVQELQAELDNLNGIIRTLTEQRDFKDELLQAANSRAGVAEAEVERLTALLTNIDPVTEHTIVSVAVNRKDGSVDMLN
jgi:hypothetical protein